MSILDKAINLFGLQRKSISTSDPYLSILLGGTVGQVAQPYRRVPSVYQAVKAISDNIAQAPLIIVDQEDNKIENRYQEVLQLFNNTKDSNGSRLTYSELMQWISGYQALKGESFLKREVLTQGQRTGTQLPSELILISPYSVSEQTGTNRNKQTVVTGWKVGSELVPLSDMLHIKDFNPYNLNRGLNPMDVIQDQLKIETYGSETQAAVLENDSTPGLLLEAERTIAPQQRNTMRREWESRHKGSNKSGKVAILDGGMKGKRLGFSNTEMQFIDMIRQVDEKIIGTWRVPKAMFGMTDDINYATFQGQLKVFWTMTLIPILKKFENAFNKEIVTPYTGSKAKVKFDLSNIEALQDDINDYADSIVKMSSVGYTRNELNQRYQLGFEENKEWGDKFFIPFSMVEAGTSNIGTTAIPEKGIKKKDIIFGREYTKAQIQFLKGLNRIHDSIHVRFYSALRRYFNGLRKRVLDSFDDSSKGFATTVNKQVEININWLREEQLMADEISPYELEAMEQGVKAGQNVTGLTPSERIKYNVQASTIQRLAFVVKQSTATNEEQINKAINTEIDAGGSVDDVKNSIKTYFNKTDNRAETIARTEITAQLNGGLLLQYDDVGVKYKEWLTNIDGFEREAHAIANHQVRRIDQPFDVGGEALMMPGGNGSPANVINCRCSVLPALEGE